MMFSEKKKMRGLTGLSFLLLLLLIGFFSLLIIKLFPVYLEHYGVTTSLRSLQNDAEASSLGHSEIKSLLLRRLEVNDTTHVNKKHIKVESHNRGTQVSVVYEVRKPFLGNVDLVVSFSDSIELSGR